MFIVLLLTILNFFSPSMAIAQSANITPAEISPASPFFFIRTLKENFEYRFSSKKTAKKLQFAKNRLKESYSAYRDGREELIVPIMEEYRSLYNYFYGNPHSKVEAIKYFSPDISVLIAFYDELKDEKAKRSVRASINHIQANNWKILDPKNGIDQSLVSELKPDLVLACNFIGRESENKNLNHSEREILKEKFELCMKNLH